MENAPHPSSDVSKPRGLARAGAPERVFLRAVGVVFVAWLALTFATLLLLERQDQRNAAAAELALVAASQKAAVRQIEASLERIARMPEGPELRTAEIALTWEVERLLEFEDRRLALARPGTPGMRRLSDVTADTLGMIAGVTDGDQALALRDLYAASLSPQAGRFAQRYETDAEHARAIARFTHFGVFGLHLAVIAMLAFLVAAPARARIADWVADSLRTDEENRFRLLHDPLTHLPNATYLRAHLDRLVAGTERATTQTAVLRLNLDRFKTLRDTLGSRVTEEILRISARRIRQVLRAGDFAAYLGQDDFVLIAPDLDDVNAVSGIAHRVQQALGKPFSLPGGARRIGCSIGVTMLSDDRPDAERALGNAEIALSEAQEAGSCAVRYFRESLRAEAERRATMFSEMIAGLDRGEFVPFFQPQIDLATGVLSGFEALVRWRHPVQGLLAPGAFLEFAETADLIDRLGEVVLAQSLAALTAWDAAGLNVPRVGINFAMSQLRDPRLIEKIKWEVERNDVEPARISIEVLETVLIKTDSDLVVRNLRGLASVGFEIELDDFGTGHASIQNLRRFMVDRIKIDRSFVFGLETSEEQQVLTSSMIAMARALGIRTLAEGVETPEAEAMLRQLGCDHFQGFLVAKPMSLADTFDWLAGFRARSCGPQAGVRDAGGDPNMP